MSNKIIKQDILEVGSGVIVHQVNNKGVMGAGLAKAIRNKWPVVYQHYKAKPPVLGTVQYVSIRHGLAVINLCSQDGYGRSRCYTSYIAMRAGLSIIAQVMEEMEMSCPVYIPYKMGCGLGGGDWKIVSKIIHETLPNAVICRSLS